MLPRWNFALALLHGDIPGATVPLNDLLAAGRADTAESAVQVLAGLVYGRALRPGEIALFTDYIGRQSLTGAASQARLRDCVALMLASPEFQWV